MMSWYTFIKLWCVVKAVRGERVLLSDVFIQVEVVPEVIGLE